MVLQRPMENGWPECDLSDTERLTIPGTALSLPIQRGQPHAIMQAFFRDVHEFNEPCTNARGLSDEGSWTENNTVYTSNHKGATAVDWNWSDHPVKIRDAGWNGSTIIPGNQVPQMRELLAWYEGMIYWGNDWNSFIDSMHFQMGYNTYGSANVARVQSFIDRKIRADGYSTYRRGGTPRGGGYTPANPIKPTTGLTAAVLHGIAVAVYGRDAQPLTYYEERFPAFQRMLRDMGANTIDRRAMAIAQTFQESAALRYVREIADGSAYEGRVDLGNTMPGDGKRFRGRGWIQLTGRSHAAGFSGWMHRQGKSSSPTEFVDHPERMETIDNAANVVVYYWTISRPQLNALADARNLEGATKAVNGGLNGLELRRKFYNAALAANANLLDSAPADPIEEILAMNVKSWSIYATPGEPEIPVVDLIRAIDAKIHRDLTDEDARAGDPEAIRRVARTAAGLGANKSAGAISHAVQVLNEINATNPQAILTATPGKA